MVEPLLTEGLLTPEGEAKLAPLLKAWKAAGLMDLFAKMSAALKTVRGIERAFAVERRGLNEQIEALRHANSVADFVAPDFLGLTASESAVVAALMARPAVSTDFVLGLSPTAAAGGRVTRKAAAVRLCKIRNKLATVGATVTRGHRGYRMTAPDKARLRELAGASDSRPAGLPREVGRKADSPGAAQ